MQLRHAAVLFGLLITSSVGCCHLNCVSSDPNDPCGYVGNDGCRTKWCRKHACRKGRACQHDYASGLDLGLDGYSDSIYPSTGSTGCGCGHDAGSQGQSIPVPTPTPVTPQPVPPVQPAPQGGGAETTMLPPGQTQYVSYEEFQRLPGTIVSGPGASVNSTFTASPTLAPPSVQGSTGLPMLSAVPVAPTSQVQPAGWSAAH